MILGAFLAALNQFDDPRFRRVIALGIGLTLALLVALYALLLGAIQFFVPDRLELGFGLGSIGGLTTLLSVGSLAIMLILSVFLMVPVASAFTGFFLDDVADAVEARSYPALPPAARAGFWESLINSLRAFALMSALTLLGFLVTLFTAGFGIVLFWLINGYLLSREYFTLVALRRMSPQEAHALRRANLPVLWAAGVLMAIPLSIPLVNLVMPVLGAASFTHLFHRLPQPSGRR